MPFHVANEDVRSVKTKKALQAAMLTLLQKYSFRKITIKGICEEASISRAAFYAHFVDKYDLLEHTMAKLMPGALGENEPYEAVKKAFNHHVYQNKSVLENLLCEADNETLGIVFAYILSTMHPTLGKAEDEGEDPKAVVLSNFYASGMISYLYWQINNKFPSGVPPMNRPLFEMLTMLGNW